MAGILAIIKSGSSQGQYSYWLTTCYIERHLVGGRNMQTNCSPHITAGITKHNRGTLVGLAALKHFISYIPMWYVTICVKTVSAVTTVLFSSDSWTKHPSATQMMSIIWKTTGQTSWHLKTQTTLKEKKEAMIKILTNVKPFVLLVSLHVSLSAIWPFCWPSGRERPISDLLTSSL